MALIKERRRARPPCSRLMCLGRGHRIPAGPPPEAERRANSGIDKDVSLLSSCHLFCSRERLTLERFLLPVWQDSAKVGQRGCLLCPSRPGPDTLWPEDADRPQ